MSNKGYRCPPHSTSGHSTESGKYAVYGPQAGSQEITSLSGGVQGDRGRAEEELASGNLDGLGEVVVSIRAQLSPNTGRQG